MKIKSSLLFCISLTFHYICQQMMKSEMEKADTRRFCQLKKENNGTLSEKIGKHHSQEMEPKSPLRL